MEEVCGGGEKHKMSDNNNNNINNNNNNGHLLRLTRTGPKRLRML